MLKKITFVFLFFAIFFIYIPGGNLTYLSKFLDKFSKIKTFEVRFKQKYFSSITEEEESGILYYKKSLKFCWKYLKPENKEFLLLGRKSYFYVPSDSQVIISKISKSDFENSIFKIFENSSIKEIKKNYRIVFLGYEDNSYGYIFFPKSKFSDIENVSIFIEKKSFLPVKIFIRNGSSQENIFLFFKYRINIKIENSIFKPNFPNDVEKIFED